MLFFLYLIQFIFKQNFNCAGDQLKVLTGISLESVKRQARLIFKIKTQA